jgi:hypothetical protein
MFKQSINFFGMKVNVKMPQGLKFKYNEELDHYRQYLNEDNLQIAWRHLERAHILGQPWVVEHTHVHWLMLMFG